MTSPSPASGPSSSNADSIAAANKHALTPLEKQRAQLSKLLKDPSKPVFIPPPPKEKTIRPPREMMKNVQGSSAGAGSGEFHVYKANRRREYERVKLMEDQTKKETEEAEFERKRREREEEAEMKTSKNRAKRLKKKERAKGKGKDHEESVLDSVSATNMKDDTAPLKKRRLVNGTELVFRLKGEGSDEEEDVGPQLPDQQTDEENVNEGKEEERIPSIPVVEHKITIIDSD
ncbi:hypothetical protein M422DRAFT_59331 [Sphaerobolus stellatus SS14]|nr:hypothetical protein M422DRAFT_59331 [Sphaerobolus stellatus SS14]